MNKEDLRNAIADGISQRKIAEIYACSQTKIRHWLKKYDLLTSRRKEGEPKRCSCCKETKPVEEFFKREKGMPTSRCKKCLSTYSTARTKDSKLNMISYKGGRCIRCSYNRCQAALEFHHRDPTQKDINPSLLKNKILNSHVIAEIDKCFFLCAGCHRELHYELVMGQRNPVFNEGQGEERKCCTKCGHDLPKSMFYGFTGSADGLSWECKPCNYQRKSNHKMKIKLALIHSVGKEASCEMCGYNKCMAALEFHHVERENKEIALSRIQSLKFTQEQLNEMKKCQVLCVNCHREIHWNQ